MENSQFNSKEVAERMVKAVLELPDTQTRIETVSTFISMLQAEIDSEISRAQEQVETLHNEIGFLTFFYGLLPPEKLQAEGKLDSYSRPYKLPK